MRTNPMPLVVAFVVLAAGVTGSVAATTATDAGTPDAPASNATQTTNASAQTTNASSGDYQPIEPPRDWTKKPVLETEIATGVSTADVSAAQGPITRQFLTSGPQGFRLTTFERRAVGDNVEAWVATNLSWGVAGNRSTPEVTDAQVQQLVDEFDGNIHPNETEIFGEPAPRDGSEAQIGPPGYYNTTADAGNKTVLLIQNIRDQNYYDPTYPLYVAGYYSPTVQTYSDRNVITLDAYDWNEINGSNDVVGYEGTLAHEYQHLIHADLDADETTWLNEGLSDYAEYAVGYGVPESHVAAYEQLPSNSLTNWEDQGSINVLADYGVAAAFVMYLDDRYGQAFVSELARSEANGIESVEETLDERHAWTDFDGLYQDFATAAATDGLVERRWWLDRYDIDGLNLSINTTGDLGTAGAWGTNYETLEPPRRGWNVGATVSGINYTETEWRTATDPVSGNGTVLYSGSGNLLDRHAIVETDLSNGANATLSFDSFQRIEANWDYGFVQVSTDGGDTWHSLENANTDASPADGAHPRVVENLPGLTGDTDGWERQEFDLSAYAGNESVLVSFRYVTDWAAIEDGWYVKNVSIAGETVPTDTVAPYMSEREATGDLVEYQFTFIGVTKHDTFRVQQFDDVTFPDGGEKTFRHLGLAGNFERIIVASNWAAEQGESGRVPVDVNLTDRSDRHHWPPGHGDGGNPWDDGDDEDGDDNGDDDDGDHGGHWGDDDDGDDGDGPGWGR